jgi:hypothetical protein
VEKIFATIGEWKKTSWGIGLCLLGAALVGGYQLYTNRQTVKKEQAEAAKIAAETANPLSVTFEQQELRIGIEIDLIDTQTKKRTRTPLHNCLVVAEIANIGNEELKNITIGIPRKGYATLYHISVDPVVVEYIPIVGGRIELPQMKPRIAYTLHLFIDERMPEKEAITASSNPGKVEEYHIPEPIATEDLRRERQINFLAKIGLSIAICVILWQLYAIRKRGNRVSDQLNVITLEIKGIARDHSQPRLP